jgi:trans-aconitate methyltransferase
LTARIAEGGAVVIGLDRSGEMLTRARAAYPRIEFVEGDARDFSFAEPFDAVFSNAALHWIRPPEAVIRCIAGCLRPGGRFVAEFGGRANVRTIMAALRTAIQRLGIPVEATERYYPGVGEYTTLLESAGLEVTFATLFDRPTPLEGENGLRDWVRMFAHEVLDAVPPDAREEFLRAVEEAAQPALFRDSGWFADYRRIRVVANRMP